MRMTKNPEERRLEIIETANKLFEAKGFHRTTVSDITKEMEVAKGTFYYYFKSKDEVIDAIVDNALEDILTNALALVEMKELKAMDKLRMIIGGALNTDRTDHIRDSLHKPKNRELHEKMNVATIRALTPLITLIVEQGVNEGGTFNAVEIEDCVGFLLTGGVQFYMDEMLFGWSSEDLMRKQSNMLIVIERTLGIEPGTL